VCMREREREREEVGERKRSKYFSVNNRTFLKQTL